MSRHSQEKFNPEEREEQELEQEEGSLRSIPIAAYVTRRS